MNAITPNFDVKMAMRRAEESRQELAAAERYIASERSDPFVRDRVYSHIRNGITKAILMSNGDRKPGSYDAQETTEARSYEKDGETVHYEVPAWHSAKRP